MPLPYGLMDWPTCKQMKWWWALKQGEDNNKEHGTDGSYIPQVQNSIVKPTADHR